MYTPNDEETKYAYSQFEKMTNSEYRELGESMPEYTNEFPMWGVGSYEEVNFWEAWFNDHTRSTDGRRTYLTYDFCYGWTMETY